MVVGLVSVCSVVSRVWGCLGLSRSMLLLCRGMCSMWLVLVSR